MSQFDIGILCVLVQLNLPLERRMVSLLLIIRLEESFESRAAMGTTIILLLQTDLFGSDFLCNMKNVFTRENGISHRLDI